jgi:ABC-type dipeptide/oligopeptide/nickel transport system permease subunit
MMKFLKKLSCDSDSQYAFGTDSSSRKVCSRSLAGITGSNPAEA